MLLSTLLLLPILAVGKPIEDTEACGAAGKLEKQCGCSVHLPYFVTSIDNLFPGTTSGPNGKQSHTYMYKDKTVPIEGSGVKGIVKDTLIEFRYIPESAYGCKLLLVFEKGYDQLHTYKNQPLIEVFTVDKEIPVTNDDEDEPVYEVSWASAPQPVNLVGTTEGVKFPANEFKRQFRLDLGPTACGTTMTFRVRVASNMEQGGLDFFETEDPIQGWMLQHSCHD